MIKYPGSWANTPLLRDWETDYPGFAARGPEQSLQIQPGGGTLQGGFSRPLSNSPSTGSPSSAPVCALGHLPPWKGEGWAGGPVCRPYGVYRSRPSFFVGAGHWPARRCTRRAESWFRPVSLALAGQFTFSRPTGCRDLHGRPHSAPTEGGRKFPKRAADSRPTKWVATCPLIRLAFARHLPPKGKAFERPQGSPLRRIRKQQHFSRRGRSQTGLPGFVPGALARQTQAQILDRTSGNFCTPRAQWPGGNSDRPLRFCAPEKMHGLSGGRPP